LTHESCPTKVRPTTNPLDAMGRERDDGSVTIFHAMPLRPDYGDLYEQVTGIR